jgi:hypothetical protein
MSSEMAGPEEAEKPPGDVRLIRSVYMCFTKKLATLSRAILSDYQKAREKLAKSATNLTREDPKPLS